MTTTVSPRRRRARLDRPSSGDYGLVFLFMSVTSEASMTLKQVITP